MGANQNVIQRAIVLVLAMMGALLNSTLNALVDIVVHDHFLLLLSSQLLWTPEIKISHGNHFQMLLLVKNHVMMFLS